MSNMKFNIEMRGYSFTTEDKDAYLLITHLHDEIVQEKRIVRALLDLLAAKELLG